MYAPIEATPEEIVSLLEAARDTASPQERELLEDEIVRHFLPMAERLAGKYRNRGADLDDLVAVANLALVKAVRGFDADKGAFPSYATSTILGEIKKHFRDHCWMIRPTRSVQNLQADIARARDTLVQRDEKVTPELLAEHLGAERSAVVEAMSVMDHFTTRSLDEPLRDGGRTLADQVADGDDAYGEVDDVLTLAAGCTDLTEAERELLRLRFYEERTQTQIAEVVGVSQMQVSRRLSALLRKIREQAHIADVA